MAEDLDGLGIDPGSTLDVVADNIPAAGKFALVYKLLLGAKGNATKLVDAGPQAAADSLPVVLAHGGALTDGSGNTSGTPGTSTPVFAANASRRFLLVQNTSDTDLWVNIGAAAATTGGSILLDTETHDTLLLDGVFVPTGAVNVACASASKSFTAKES